MQIYKNLTPEIKQHVNNFLQEKKTFGKVLKQLEQFNVLKIKHNLNNYNFLKLLRKESITFYPTRYFFNSLLVTGQLTNIFNSGRFKCRFNTWGNRCEDCKDLNYKYLLENIDIIYANYRRLHERFDDVQIYFKWTNQNPQMHILAELATEPDFTDSESDISSDDSDGYADTVFIPSPHLTEYFNRNNPCYDNISDSETETETESDDSDGYNLTLRLNQELTNYLNN